MPTFLGRCVHDAKIDEYSSRADYHVTFKYKRDIETAIEWGENPEQILGSVAHFTTKIKAQAFVNVVEIVAKPGAFASAIAALGLTSAFTIVLSTILSEVTVFVGSFVILVSAMR